MSQIGIVFFSKCGATKAVAQALAEGVEAQSQSITMIEVLPSEIVEGRYINEQKIKQLGE